jgi:hypothetical protein
MKCSWFFTFSLVLFIVSPATSLLAQPSMLTRAPVVIAGQPELTASFRDPINIDLRWRNDHPSVRGHLVEYTSNSSEEFVVLGILPVEKTTFAHPDLAPQTKYFYRLRPYMGEASSEVIATTGKDSGSPPPGSVEDGEPVIDAADAATTTKKKSLRDPATSAISTPEDLTFSAPSPRSVSLKWRDRANDEDGYLLEAAGPSEAFYVVAFLPVDTVGFTIPNLPPETACRFRVRAFFYGPSSNVVERLTGDEPARGQ